MDGYTEKIMREKTEKTAKKKLKTRILEALKSGRSTTDALAKQLGVSSKAIDGHLYRMAGSADGTKKGTGEVKRAGWGLYELAQ
jgi:predicted ArsR family transcriptional regulator